MTHQTHHRAAPARMGTRRAIVTSVLASLAVSVAAVSAAAFALPGTESRPTAAAIGPTTDPDPTTASTAPAELAAPVEVLDVREVAAAVVLVSAGLPQVDDIPSMARSAYQRAESVLNSADARCRLDWTLIAAIGHVVSDHGRRDDGRINADGVVRPALVGRAVRNAKGRRLTDTDAGQLDSDGRYDRAVGPMLLAPTTWGVVGVDADGDGRRNPQDVDDAALAVAVLLCSGDENVQRVPDRANAVERVNDDAAFVKAVLEADAAYRTQLAAAPTTPPAAVAIAAGATPLPTDIPTVPDPSATTDDPSDAVTLLPGSSGTQKPPKSKPTKPPKPTDPIDTATPDPCDEPTDTPTDSPTTAPTADPSDDGRSTDCPPDSDPVSAPATESPSIPLTPATSTTNASEADAG